MAQPGGCGAEPEAKRRKMDCSHLRGLIVPVLSDEEERDCQLTSVTVARILKPQETNQILKFLTAHFPVPELSHLKRLHKTKDEAGEVICELKKETEGLQEILENFAVQFQVTFESREVPKFPALNERQRSAWAPFWTLNFKKIIPTSPPTSSFSDNDVIKIHQFIEEARAQGALAKKQGNKNVGCVIVDPRNGWSVVGVGQDAREKLIAVSHAAINCLEAISERYSNGEEIGESEYLCTEPCVMCSMALLHSRIAAVFYARPNKKNGGLGSKFKIHCHKSLNHHFYAYKINSLEL